MICKKCNSLGFITLREKDVYCSTCFIININHKFRSCIGKNRILSSSENVLVCVSGGGASMVLLDLIYNGIALDSHKKLRISPIFLHLLCGEESTAKIIIEQIKKYNFSIYIVNMSAYFNENLQLMNANTIPKVNDKDQNKLNDILIKTPSSICSDFLPKLKRNLYMKCAELLKCSYIFTGETNSTLAINLLRNLAVGRGSQVQNDIGFMDSRSENIKILRPMKDISEEELLHYINIKKLVPILHNDKQPTSLHTVISHFVNDLQENFQSTISTICKTADKIGINEKKSNIIGGRCVLCESDITKKELKLSAFEATNFSRMVSHCKLQDANRCNPSLESYKDNEENHKLMFPLIHKKLCYSCSRDYFEMSPSTLPAYIQQLLVKKDV